MGTVISFINDKGGVGKSTSAIILADYLSRVAGKKVALVDTDARQTSIDWYSEVVKSAPIPNLVVLGNTTAAVGHSMQSMASQYDYVICDGMSSFLHQSRRDVIAAMIKASDVILIPTLPYAFDIWAVEQTAGLIQQRQELADGKPLTVLFGASVRENTNDWKEFRQSASEAPFPVLDSSIPMRLELPRLLGKGLSPFEKSSPPVKQMLIEWVQEIMALAESMEPDSQAVKTKTIA